jgi:acetoin utilization deacetylase AcuC-like enzyme
MFRIHRVFDVSTPTNRQLLSQVLALALPILVVQDGGYKAQTLGVNARHFFSGLWAGMPGTPVNNPAAKAVAK